jgi:hypothetical protein
MEQEEREALAAKNELGIDSTGNEVLVGLTRRRDRALPQLHAPDQVDHY